MTVKTLPKGEFKECPKHGRYELRFLRPISGVAGRWIGDCPQCNAEREAEDRERMRCQEVFALQQRAAVPHHFAGKLLAHYHPRTPRQRDALETCRAYVRRIEERLEAGTCLVLIGPVGVGKTHLLAAVVQESVQQCVEARYSTASDFLAEIRGNWIWNSQEFGKPFVRPELLALDEVWIPANEREREALVALVDARYRAQQPTLLASNLQWPQLKAELGERLCDRLLEGGGRIVSLDGESFRSQPRD